MIGFILYYLLTFVKSLQTIAANNVSAVCRSEARIAKHHGTKKIAPAKNGRRASGGETLTVSSE